GRLGVFWHTQGAGKSASMIFFSQKVLRKIPGNWTFVIITDRTELDDQIYKTFRDSGVITEGHVQASSSRHLRQLLSEDHRFIFTLIHKFRTENGQKHPVLSERENIIVITDEAHRSQYDILAQNMREALPNAAFLGFTGTPLIKGEEEKTREVFGDYVSIYNFSQSIADGATVPLYYENRIPEVQLTNEHLNEDLNRLLDEAMLDAEQEKKLEREFSKMYHIVTREDRLEKIAEDVVNHFMSRGFLGKAMYVAIDKATAVKMFDKVQAHWKEKIEYLREKWRYATGQDRSALKEKIDFMETTDMAVVVSQGQNEVEELKKKGVDILPHRRRMINEELDIKFKDPDNPFRIAFVCAMWMTGFDVPSCSTIYLDKPMRNHTLMQTIARANRVFSDKENGLIVDYVGVFRNLEKALAIYGAPGEGGDLPIMDKAELLGQLKNAIAEVEDYVRPIGVDLEKIRKEEDVFRRVALKDEAVNNILVNDDTKIEFLSKADSVKRILKAYLPDPLDQETGEMVYLIRRIAKSIRSIEGPPDISGVMAQVETLLDESVEGFEIREPKEGFKKYDLSKINFDELRRRFREGKKRIELERLREAIEDKLHFMILANRTRMDFKAKFDELIQEYNNGSASIEDTFNKLLNFTKTLEEEEKRFMREGLQNEEELAVFDLLTKPDMKLSKKEEKEVKKIAHELLENLKKQKFVLDWKKKQQTRAGVQLAISEYLDKLPP
ncbi:MAG TPA: type I restriction endonuclease subunit R, partial [bacterium]|nr:type I restriction endonuclease subunit R [bacterium]